MTALTALLLAGSLWLQAAAGDSLLVLDPVRWPEAVPGEAFVVSVGPAQDITTAGKPPPGVRPQRALRVTLYRFAGHHWLRLDDRDNVPDLAGHHEACLSLDFYDLTYRAPGAAGFVPESVRWLDPTTFELVDEHAWTDAAGAAQPGPRVLRMRYVGKRTVVMTAR